MGAKRLVLNHQEYMQAFRTGSGETVARFIAENWDHNSPPELDAAQWQFYMASLVRASEILHANPDIGRQRQFAA